MERSMERRNVMRLCLLFWLLSVLVWATTGWAQTVCWPQECETPRFTSPIYRQPISMGRLVPVTKRQPARQTTFVAVFRKDYDKLAAEVASLKQLLVTLQRTQCPVGPAGPTGPQGKPGSSANILALTAEVKKLQNFVLEQQNLLRGQSKVIDGLAAKVNEPIRFVFPGGKTRDVRLGQQLPLNLPGRMAGE